MSDIESYAQSEAGRAELTAELGLCTPLEEGAEALRLLELWVENAFALLGEGVVVLMQIWELIFCFRSMSVVI